MQKGFGAFLDNAVSIANGVVGKKAFESQQFVTPYTVRAERLTSFFTGIPIDSSITEREKAIVPWGGAPVAAETNEKIRALNENVRTLTGQLADFIKQLLFDSEHCRIFTMNYTVELQHMYDETKHYIANMDRIEQIVNPIYHGRLAEELEFWNKIMASHNKTVAGRLDPTEEKLIGEAERFANEFNTLSADTAKSGENLLDLKSRSREAVKKLQAFQTKNIEKLMNCGIRSVISPLQMDHHIRETAHFEFILEAAPGQKV